MASSLQYTPQLTAWHDGERDCVEHEGTVYAVRRHRERVEIGGKVFTVADEKEVAVHGHGSKAVRCVEYRTSPSAEALRLTVTEGAEKEVAEVVGPDGALRVMECGGSYYAKDAGTWEHVVDVQGEEEAFMLLVSVRARRRRASCASRGSTDLTQPPPEPHGRSVVNRTCNCIAGF